MRIFHKQKIDLINYYYLFFQSNYYPNKLFSFIEAFIIHLMSYSIDHKTKKLPSIFKEFKDVDKPNQIIPTFI